MWAGDRERCARDGTPKTRKFATEPVTAAGMTGQERLPPDLGRNLVSGTPVSAPTDGPYCGTAPRTGTRGHIPGRARGAPLRVSGGTPGKPQVRRWIERPSAALRALPKGAGSNPSAEGVRGALGIPVQLLSAGLKRWHGTLVSIAPRGCRARSALRNRLPGNGLEVLAFWEDAGATCTPFGGL